MFRNIFILISILSFPIISAQGDKVIQLHSVELASIISADPVTLIDVRTESEFANGHIENAGQLNYYALDFKKKLLLLPKEKPVYLYCNTGYRSQRAARTLVENGYEQVYNLERGIMEWELIDLEVIVEPDARPDTKNKMQSDEYLALMNSERPVLIDFYAPWCGPCRQMMPMIDSMKMAYANEIDIIKINADASKKLIKELNIGSVPHFKIFQSGEEVFSHSGMITDEKLRDLFKRLL